MNVVLDFAGHIILVTDAKSVNEVMLLVEANGALQGVNVAYQLATYDDPQEYADDQAFPVTILCMAELESYNRSGCQFDECHSYATGPDHRSSKYCDEHAGMVTDDYVDVRITWEGMVDSDERFSNRAEFLAYVDKEEADIKAQIAEGNIPNKESGGAVISASYHTHEFETREQYDAWEGDCSCESYETMYDSTKDEELV
jgi:hypothetical protein